MKRTLDEWEEVVENLTDRLDDEEFVDAVDEAISALVDLLSDLREAVGDA